MKYSAIAGMRLVLAALAISIAAFLPDRAAADDSTRMKQLRLLCVQLSGDLTDPGGMAAFRRCLTTHDPLNEIRRDNNIGGAPRIVDRVGAAPPAGFGRNSRTALAQQVRSFRIDGHIVYAVGGDGTLWHFDPDTKAVGKIAPSAATFRIVGDGQLFVVDREGVLWHMKADGSGRTAIDHAVAEVQPVGGNLIYVRGTDGTLWRETASGAGRVLVDQNVTAFQAIDASLVFVLGSDARLWRETGDMHSRVLVAGAIRAFQYVPDGDAIYVLTTSNVLWRQTGKDKPEQVDHDVAAFYASDMHLAYVLGKDGRLWQELGNRDQAVLVDREVALDTKDGAFEIVDVRHIYLVDNAHKLWAEAMPSGR